MKSAEIREKFLSYFAERGHTIVRSSSLVPGNDPTMLLTNSGMVQFKDVFLGLDRRAYTRAVSVQRCVRAGGKHNDLENVGYTARHHTFFEMLGNFSFGDYFKQDAIRYAWELLTDVYGLPQERLWITVYEEDDEAYDIWVKEIGLPEERVIRIGDNRGARYASDNFWQMADVGPCGPCSEIFYDHGPHIAGGLPGTEDEDGDRYIEIWNLVFMQYNRQEDGTLTPLPMPSVDTGMGLERLAAVMQHVNSNYDIDLFNKLVRAAARETGETDLSHNSLKVIADHIRASAFMIVDGLIPGNEGHGYVLRRIIRRALRHGHKLGMAEPFFYRLVKDLAGEMSDAYPELREAASNVERILLNEEERFSDTLENGMKILEAALAGNASTLDGETAFTLYDTYGFPIDLTADICRERGIQLDHDGFEKAMERQRETARASGKFRAASLLDYHGPSTKFVGYTDLEAVGKVIALYVDGIPVEAVTAGQKAVIVTDETPFYAESGGQAGDSGILLADGVRFEVEDTLNIQPEVASLHGLLSTGKLAIGDVITAHVNQPERIQIMRNHSVTHLMHKALREVLGKHVAQRGSLVDAQRTRFDFSHTAPLTQAEIREVEAIVNAEILSNREVLVQMLPFDQAIQRGAAALFGEKYADVVRVVDVGFSCELCGGTHVTRTGDIGLFKIISEGGIAAGIRRVEAVTGLAALELVQNMANRLSEAAHALRTGPDDLLARINQMQEQVRGFEREISSLKGKLATNQGGDLISQAVDIQGVKVLAATIESADPAILRSTMDKMKDTLKSAAIVLASVNEGKVSLIAGVTKDMTEKIRAGDLVNHVAKQVGGKGGGRADMAQAGGTDPSALPAALKSVNAWIGEKLG